MTWHHRDATRIKRIAMPMPARFADFARLLLGLLLWPICGCALSQECAKLTGLKLDHAYVTSAQSMAAGSAIQLPGGETVAAAKAEYCRVQITATPSADSDIRIELWIPNASAWNGKFEQVGNGGFAGVVPYDHMARVLSLGYATAGTDDGHRSESGIDASWALHHPEKVKDFGWRAISETTVLSKLVLHKLMAKAPTKSYFVGCSDGGREALMMAQRFPVYFDGIVAGAPAYAMTRLLSSAALRRAQLVGGVAHLTTSQLGLLQDRALQTCGNGAAFLKDPRQCHVELATLKCAGGQSDGCLSQAQIDAVQELYADRKDPADGATLYGVLPGAEAVKGSWDVWLTGMDGNPGAGFGFMWNYLAFMVMNDPKLDVTRVTTADIVRGERQIKPVIDADSADLSAFKQHGGKLIQYHGWNDPGIAPGFSVEYRERLLAKTGPADDFYRLYMVPGMLHCGGGQAPTRVDWQAALENWVEKSEAPGTLIASDGKGAAQTLEPFK